MPKRKRGQSDGDVAQKLETQRKNVEGKIVHGKKLLNRAMKLAKNFERRKLARKLKLFPDRNGAEMKKLQREYDVLKALNLSNVVNNYVHKNLLKSKSVLDSGLLPSHVTNESKPAVGPEELFTIGDVTARMFNTRIVKETTADIFASIYSALGITQPGESLVNEERTAGNESESNGIQEGLSTENLSEEEQSNASNVERCREKWPKWEGFSSDLGPDPPQNLPSDESIDAKPRNRRTVFRAHSLSPSLSEEVCLGLAVVSSPPAEMSELVHNAPDLPVSKAPASTFLPTLMGGYWSGSEDDAGGVEDHDGAAAAPAHRKNRRGQQARRAIWEKKFGAQANHLRAQAARGKRGERIRDRIRVRDARRGPPNRSGRGGDKQARPVLVQDGEDMELRLRSWSGREKGHNEVPRPLHPSWEAVRRAKAAKADTTFKGTKVVFD